VHRYGGYRTVDLLASYDLPGARRTRLTARIDNLTDRRYATSAGVTGGVTTYNPAAPRSVMLGVSVDL
jgi:outer membrane receptor protein involved in Fe transport